MLNTKDVLKITKHEIKAKYKSIIYIDQKMYDNKTIIETSTDFIIPGLIDIFIPEFNDFCQIITEYNINVSKPIQISDDNNIIKLSYNPDDLIIHQKIYSKNTNMALIIKLLEGRAKYIKSPELLTVMIFNQLKNLSKIDLIHIELIVSNMFRMKNNPDIKCRETGDFSDPIIIGQIEHHLLTPG